MSGQDLSLDPTPADDESSVSPIAWLADESEDPSESLERQQIETRRSDGLRAALSRLDERSRRIIEARWLREDDAADAAASSPTSTASPPSASARSRARR